MPVVLVEVGGVARSGHLYGDQTWISYEYPLRRHSSYISTGDRFVYQKPGLGYFGCGVIGEIHPSVSDSSRLVCDVLSATKFEVPVGLKDAAGDYYEADPTYWADKIYWGQGVRPLSEERFDAIVTRAGATASSSNTPTNTRTTSYADPKTAKAVEDYSVAVAMSAMEARFVDVVTVMPRNNPGFDLRVGSMSAPVRFVEVKGTQAGEPLFFMSEGERKFSIRNAASYTLVVVSGIDLKNQSHAEVVVRDGAVDGPDFELTTTQWRGRVLSPGAVAPS